MARRFDELDEKGTYLARVATKTEKRLTGVPRYEAFFEVTGRIDNTHSYPIHSNIQLTY